MSILRRVFGVKVLLAFICVFTILIVSKPTNATAHASRLTARSTAKSIADVQAPALTNEQNIHVMAAQLFSNNFPQGMGTTFGQYQPHVGSNDVGPNAQSPAAASIAQLSVANDNITKATATLEFGWIVAPQHYRDALPHMFVFTRYVDSLGILHTCLVQQDSSGNWNCNFHALTSTPPLPESAVSVGALDVYAVVHNNSNWYIQYDNNSIGYIPDTQWNGTLTQVVEAQWFGEVGTYHNPACEDMGNGLRGSQDGSAQINDMFLIPGNGGSNIDAQATISYDRQDLYDASHFVPNNPNAFHSFTYGGPASQSLDCNLTSANLTPNAGPSGMSVVANGSNWLVGSAQPGDQICSFWDTGGGAPMSCTTLGQDGTFTVNFTVPANQSMGQHTVDFEDMDALNNLTSVMFTVATVTVQKVWTGDSNNNSKTSFAPGDAIHYLVQVENFNSNTVTTTFTFYAAGEQQIFFWSGPGSVPPGTPGFYSPSTVPTDAPAGIYTLTITVAYNGASIQGQSQFTVT